MLHLVLDTAFSGHSLHAQVACYSSIYQDDTSGNDIQQQQES